MRVVIADDSLLAREHLGGLDARPREYELRVVSFFNRALLGSPAAPAPGRARRAS